MTDEPSPSSVPSTASEAAPIIAGTRSSTDRLDGPHLTSALHPIGNVWSNYYRDGDLLLDPEVRRNVVCGV